ncbi:MAG: ABZJ_00895 family protein [Pseudomonadota bacterium]
MLRIFLVWYAAGVLLISAAYVYADFHSAWSLVGGVMITAVAAAAERNVKRGGGTIAGGEAWSLAFHMTLLATLVSILFFALAILLDPEDAMAPWRALQAQASLVAIVAVGIFALNLLVIRFTLTWFIRMELRRAERRQNR